LLSFLNQLDYLKKRFEFSIQKVNLRSEKFTAEYQFLLSNSNTFEKFELENYVMSLC